MTVSGEHVEGERIAPDTELARLRSCSAPRERAEPSPPGRGSGELVTEAVGDTLDRITAAMQLLADRVNDLERWVGELDDSDRRTVAVRDEYLVDLSSAADRDTAAREVEQAVEAER